MNHALALMLRRTNLSQVRGIGRAGFLLFNLQEERIVGAVALHVNDVVTQSDAAGTHNPKRDIQRPIEIEEMATLR